MYTATVVQVDTMRQMSFRKYQMTASSVPIWVTAVNDAPGSELSEELREDRQVGTAGDREELRQALKDAEQDRLEPGLTGHSAWRRTLSTVDRYAHPTWSSDTSGRPD